MLYLALPKDIHISNNAPTQTNYIWVLDEPVETLEVNTTLTNYSNQNNLLEFTNPEIHTVYGFNSMPDIRYWNSTSRSWNALLDLTTVTIYHKTMVGETERLIVTEVIGADPSVQFQHYVGGIAGYIMRSVDGCEMEENFSGAQGGTLYGSTQTPLEVVVWYENHPNIIPLKDLVENSEDNIGYTEESWNAYQAELTRCTEFYNKVKDNVKAMTYQEQIYEYVDALTAARAALAVPETNTEIMSLRLTSSTVAKGKRAVLVITTTADVASLVVKENDIEVPPASCTSKASVNSDGVQIKTWYLQFVVSTVGDHTYTLHAGSASQEFTVVCH